MKLLVDGKEQPFLGLSFCESLDQFYPYYLLTVPAQIHTDRVQLVDKRTDTYYVMRGELQKKTYVYTIVYEPIYQILNRTYPSFTGTTTIQGLLTKLSIKNDIDGSTGMVPWRVPTYKFTGLINYLSKFTVVANGGAPKFFLDLEGVLHLYDLRQILSRNNPTVISSFGISSETMASDWILRDVGAVDIYTGKNSPSRFTIESNTGLGSSFINDTTGNEVSLVQRLLTTNYYTKKYTAHKVTISQGTSPLKIGSLVTIDKVAKFVVYARSASIPISKEPAQISYVLVSAV